MLQVIESTAPNLSSFDLFVDHPAQLSLGESSQVKKLHLGFSRRDNLVSYSITRLPSIVPHLETLIIDSNRESIDTPMAANIFLHLKYLEIFLQMDYVAISPTYDYLALVSFLDASPALETFILSVNHVYEEMKHVSVYGDVFHMTQIHGHKHQRLKEGRSTASALQRAWLTWHAIFSTMQPHLKVLQWTPYGMWWQKVILVGALTKEVVNAALYAGIGFWKRTEHSALSEVTF
ncbi:hypothetical protein BS78_06G259600 [Paspalum vaginatum]|nr:hypothetical protein BS78_06G259600 [Paspalum vaginatum]